MRPAATAGRPKAKGRQMTSPVLVTGGTGRRGQDLGPVPDRGTAGRPEPLSCGSLSGEHVDVELVPLRVSHAAPAETLKFARAARLEPAAAECLDLRRGRVEIRHDQVEMEPVL